MLRTRIITALIIAPIALAGVFLLPLFEFSLFVGAILVVAAWEWANFGGLKGVSRYIYAGAIALIIAAVGYLAVPSQYVLIASLTWWLIAFVLVARYPGLDNLWGSSVVTLAIGVVMLVPGWVALKELKQFPDSSYLICLLFFLIWGADIGAYFSGKAFGKHKLAVAVSPGKTWEGFAGGLVAVLAIAVLMSLYFRSPALAEPEGMIFLALCLVVGMVSVLGDLAVSMFKRRRNIKDSSDLLPGHGGFLDRIDSLLSATPLFSFYLSLVDWL